jgi:GDP-4-dehydro-6-deoxy-D-mannose reductase
MRRAIVTGGAGFIGRHLVAGLRRRGVHVTTIGRRPSQDARHVALGDGAWSVPQLARILEDNEPDAVFHLAGGSTGGQAELDHLNVGLATALMQALRETGLRPVLVVAGSATEYGAAIVDGAPVCESAECAPISAYGRSKLAQTSAALAYGKETGAPVLAARIFNPIGAGIPTHLALGAFAAQIASVTGTRGKLRTGNIDVERDLIDVEHVATMLYNLTLNHAARNVINICSGEAVRLRTLVEYLISVSGKSIDIETDPSRVRPKELRVIVGSTALLATHGEQPPPTDYPAVVARIWAAAQNAAYGAAHGHGTAGTERRLG